MQDTKTADKLTPLMKQYNSIKAKYPETILFFRMGDFFETFGPDAITTAKVTGIVLTKRGNGSASEIELAGFPHHQLDAYLPKMIRAGYRVAVCEQLEDPKLAKGIVKRDVVEVVTPGVTASEKLLDTHRNTYVGAIVMQSGVAGIAYADVSTGEFVAGEIPEAHLAEHLDTLGLRELLVARKDVSKTELAPYYVALTNKPAITRREDWIFHYETARELLLQHFKTASLKGFGIDDLTVGITAAGTVLDYLRETRSQTSLSHVTHISRYEPKDYLALDASTRRNLEIFSPLQGGNPDASLLGVLDETSSSMGARLLRRWLARPLRSHERINQRLAAVETFNANREARDKLCSELRELGDVERLVGRFAGARILQPRDFLALKFSLWHLPEIQKLLVGLVKDDGKGILTTVSQELHALPELAEELDRFVAPEPPATAAHLGVIRDGANTELDELRALTRNSRDGLLAIQARERERTGITSLKVDYNNVFGYFIEVSKANQAKVPADYERRQTMTNAERYITPELKEYEAKILGAEERMATIEREMIEAIRARIIQDIAPLTRNAELLAVIDVLATFSALATKHRWTRPEFNEIGEFAIELGRHPVVEKLLPVGERFTANSVLFKPGEFEFYVITGPNMSGKSVYLRQCGVLAYLAHVGSFVPAERANFPNMDRIFTRVGASDNVASGESTFLVEMNEAANMLNNATADSLLLFDELGRGTSTFDGLSIAWAVSEYIHDNLPGARTLFATHYHELNALAERHAHIHNLKVEVREAEGKVHFLHKIAPGHADHSYGIEVAAMAGIPPEVLDRAREILRSLEATELVIAEANIQREIPFVEHSTRAEQEARLKQAFGDERVDAVASELRALDLDTLTPIEAINKIAEWKRSIA